MEGIPRTYTFCGTPGYVAPENVLANGYSFGVDWWSLGVLLHVLLTGRQPFSSPRTNDPMVVIRRIIDPAYIVSIPPYVSEPAKHLIRELLERKPYNRLGMRRGLADDIKRHKWFQGFDWEALAARKMPAPRKPQDDAGKRLQQLEEEAATARREPSATTEELYECDYIFAAF